MLHQKSGPDVVEEGQPRIVDLLSLRHVPTGRSS